MAVHASEALPENPVDLRAPPPSPIASGRRSSVTNDGVLTEFLEHSLRVPALILPDRAFPCQKSIQRPPKLDLQSLDSPKNDPIISITASISQIGCFELVNHGIPRNLIFSVLNSVAGIFRISSEKKMMVSRSQERPYGFEEGHGEEEEFVWLRDEGLKLEMEEIWSLEYPNFSVKMEKLLFEIEKVANKILQVLHKNKPRKSTTGIYENGTTEEEEEKEEDEEVEQKQPTTICYLHKHGRDTTESQSSSSLKHDVIRMLIKGSEHSYSLCLYVCNGTSEFHVYSKKTGWVAFCPDQDALIITIGDQLQARSGGLYKHVMGRPIFKGENEDSISIAFLYSEPSTVNSCNKERGKTISLGQQALMAVLLTLVYHIFICIYKLF